MQIPILIEPIEGGRFRARAGEPFALTAEGDSAGAAVLELERLMNERLSNGARLTTVNLPNGPSDAASHPPFPADELYLTDPSFAELRQIIAEQRRLEEKMSTDEGSSSTGPAPFYLEPLPDDDWFFRELREAIAENRRTEDKVDQ